MWWVQQQATQPQTKLRPIVQPGASLVGSAWGSEMGRVAAAALVVAFVALVVGAAVAVGSAFGPGSPLLVLLPTLAVSAGVARRAHREVVRGPGWTFRGARIDGEAFGLLEDIDARFAYAEANVKRLPTGIEWSEVSEDVRALLWEAAEHAAAVTALDAQVHDMRYADPGTPQAALKTSLEQERAAHWNIMRGVQWEAERLARTAGNAVAAAHVALARTGSLAELQRITPSRRAIVAAGALAEARSHLELLAEVWSELDETGTIAAERLRELD